MTQQHPITPPLELVTSMIEQAFNPLGATGLSNPDQLTGAFADLVTRAAQWGADQELEACCEWLHWQNLATHPELIPSLRAARRSKPPSLKEQALMALEDAVKMADYTPPEGICSDQANIIRRALDQLDD
jgi:hypothetical protein